MTETPEHPTTADQEGREWSSTAPIWDRHWARHADPARELIAARTAIGPGKRVLDMGCGTGEFCRIATDLGATAAGIDAAEGMLQFARSHVPGADLRHGALERLPWAEDSFDVVTGFNSFQFAAERVAGFREARRVVRPGGLVAVVVWGPSDRNELPGVFAALEGLAPEPIVEDQGREPRFGEPGVLEGLASEAGLSVIETGDVDVPYERADRDELLAALEFDVALLRLRGRVDDEVIERTLIDAAAPHRHDDGSYRFDNSFRWLVAEA